MKYEYSYEGIKSFIECALDEALDNYPPIVVNVGPHTIEIPMHPDTFARLEEMLSKGYADLTADDWGV